MNKQTNLGRTFALSGTSLNLYRVGYGAVQLAGPGVWGLLLNIDEAVAVLRDAVAAGVNRLWMAIPRIDKNEYALRLPNVFLRLLTKSKTSDFPMTLAKWFFIKSAIDSIELAFYHHTENFLGCPHRIPRLRQS